MKKVLVCLLVTVFTTPVALAYNPIKAEPRVQYESIIIEGDPYLEHNFLGTLEESPHTYEFTTEVAITFTATVMQRSTSEPVPFGLLFVRQNDEDGGVTEVARSIGSETIWWSFIDSGLGITLLRGDTVREEIEPGTYRLEVSTPDNRGTYMLVVGEEPLDRSYLQTLIDVAKIQYHFGYTPFHLPLSRYVYYPAAILGILLILGFRYRARRLQKNKQYVRFTD